MAPTPATVRYELSIAPPYLLFLGDAQTTSDAKTACGVAYWRPQLCMAQLRLEGCKVNLGLPDMSVENAAASGVRTLIVGLAPLGGELRAEWIEILTRALRCGLDIASGLHTRLAEHPALGPCATELGRRIHDVRAPRGAFGAATYRKRSGKRLLTIGTDCAVGKKYTALALERELLARSVNAQFRATGQTGILIAGSGIAVDAVVADFLAGAAETLSPDAAANHWDLVEGQGSLFHPSYAGVSLGLLHGTQPDALVLCHDGSRTVNGDFPDLPLPSLEACAELNLRHAHLVNPAARLVGVSLNTSAFSTVEAREICRKAQERMGVPAVDPVRTGVGPIAEQLLDRD